MKRILTMAALAVSLASGAWAGCQIDLMALPVTMIGTQPMVSGAINGTPERFLADSGAYYSVLSPDVTTELKLSTRRAPEGYAFAGLGGIVTPRLTTVRQFSINGQTFANVQFLVGGSDIGADAAGILGQNFWRLWDDEYDLANGVIRLAEPNGCVDQSLAYWAKADPVSVIELIHNVGDRDHTLGYARINGARIKVLFDTGAGASFLSFSAAKRIGIDPEGQGTEAAGGIGGIGRGGVSARTAPVDSFEIGDEKILHTRLLLDHASADDFDMLLGEDFFLSHRIYVANHQRKIYFTYNGGPVFALRARVTAASVSGNRTAAPAAAVAPNPQTANTPSDLGAAELSRRGAAAMGRLEYAQAVADLTRAHDLAPTEPQYLYQRGVAYEQQGETERALADLGEAHMLDPTDVDILITRAEVRVKEHTRSLALADLDAASRELPVQADSRFRLGTLYTQADGFGQASREFDTWIKFHPDDGKLAAAFYDRCRAGSLGGSDLPAALRACEAALRRNPKSGRFHEGLGLAHLRMGDLNAALADYDTALGIDHQLAWALYGRGVIELKRGKADQAKTDMAAATALDEELAEQWRRVGLAP